MEKNTYLFLLKKEFQQNPLLPYLFPIQFWLINYIMRKIAKLEKANSDTLRICILGTRGAENLHCGAHLQVWLLV